MKKFLIAILFFLSVIASAHATNYYIADNGSDSNNGTSKVTPWLHHPSMTGATGTAAAHTIVPDDHLIFRGCDSWHNTSTPSGFSTWDPLKGANGTSGHTIYVGGGDQTWSNGACSESGIVDTDGNQVKLLGYGESTPGVSSTPFVPPSVLDGSTGWAGGTITINGVNYTISSVQTSWQLTLTTSAGTQRSVTYTASLWNRPILDGDSAVVSAGDHNYVETNQQYYTFDMFEVKDLYFDNVTSSNGALWFNQDGDHYMLIPFTVSDLYIHKWTHIATSATQRNSIGWYMINGGNNAGASIVVGPELADNDIDGGDSLDTQFYNSSTHALQNCNTGTLPNSNPVSTYWPDGYCASGSGLYSVGYSIHDNHFRYLQNGVVIGDIHNYANNVTERIYQMVDNFEEYHDNGWEFNDEYGAGGTLMGYPAINFIDGNITRYVTAAVVSWLTPAVHDYVFNNLWYQNPNGQSFDYASPGLGSILTYGLVDLDNNTVVNQGTSFQGYANYQTGISSLSYSGGTGTAAVNSWAYQTGIPIAVVGSSNATVNSTFGTGSPNPTYTLTGVLVSSVSTPNQDAVPPSQSASNCLLDGSVAIPTATSDGNGVGTYNFSSPWAGTTQVTHTVSNCGALNWSGNFSTLNGTAITFSTSLSGSGSATGGSITQHPLNTANNLWINTTPAGGTWVGTVTKDVSWTTAQANTAGATEATLFIPTNSNCNGVSPCNVGFGTNFTASNCTTATALCLDSTLGDTRTAVSRPTGGTAWDDGDIELNTNAPSPPSSASGSNGGSVGAHTVTVTWNASITSGVGYFIFRGTSSGQESGTPLNMSAVGTNCTGPSGGCTYTDSTVIAGQNLFYTVESYNGTVFSAPSNEISTTVPVSAPTGLVISH